MPEPLPPLPARLADALRRRLRFAWRRATAGGRRPAVEAALEWLLAQEIDGGLCDPAQPGRASAALTAASVETALAYGCRAEAARWSEWATEPEPGEPPVGPPTASRALARDALQSYRLGDRAAGDRALRRLERRQRRNGSLPRATGGWPTGAAADPWAVKYYLDAALLRVAAAFEERWQELPEGIDPGDGRMQAVRAWLDRLGPEAKVADLGCGNGRFLKHLVEWFPGVRLVGIDVSQAMLARLPEGVEPREGSLLRIPGGDGEFDGAFAVESLEHALVPERAVAELCRVVRPGGRVLVVDKHRAKQPLSEHDPWERWFLPEELARWLGRYCDAVAVEPVAHAEGRGGAGLFLAAGGRRTMQPCADDSP